MKEDLIMLIHAVGLNVSESSETHLYLESLLKQWSENGLS